MNIPVISDKNPKTSKNEAIFAQTYNMAIGEAYYKSIRSLIREYYVNVSNAAISEYLKTGNFAELTARELLAKSGLDMHYIDPKVNKAATEFVAKLEMQSKSKFRKAYTEAKKPIPQILLRPTYNQQTKNLVSQQVRKIKGLLDYQYTRIDDALQDAIVNNKSMTSFKESLRQAGLYNEKRIKTIAYNQLHYGTNAVNSSQAVQLGLEYGIWKHPPKSSYKTEGRPSHIAADGKMFKLSKGLKIDGKFVQCGELPNCKCYYQIVI